ncbi:universal stress protein [Massilia sp. METH4]|uniref:universal stress protein n=1 Tax=Massilia sp. METH4 TaxID=3123041 RepID=UPI0030D54B27
MNDLIDSARPQHLLLATDLTARCDRPLDRAKQLALEWRAGLTALVVQQGPSTPEEVSAWLDGGDTSHAFAPAARAELAEEFAGTGVEPVLQVLEGDVTDGILAAAATLGNGLVVIGASSDVAVHEVILGSTATRLVQDLAQPLLVVRRRTRGPYARILVANDFSDASRQALGTAVRLFPDRPITLFHAIDAEADAAEATARSRQFLDASVPDAGQRGRIGVAVGHGLVSEAIGRRVVEDAIGLVVIGVHPQWTVARVFKGSTSEDLLQQLPCDALLVRAAEGGDDG